MEKRPKITKEVMKKVQNKMLAEQKDKKKMKKLRHDFKKNTMMFLDSLSGKI